MELETMRLEVKDHIGTLTLDRPDCLNAINMQWMTDFEDAIEEANRDPSVRVVIITGAGRGFCAGADLREWAAFEGMADELMTRSPKSGGVRVYTQQLQNLEKPVIAAVNGPAVGGGFALALACDIALASERATFSQMFIKRGLVPDSGASYFLPRKVGLPRALELILTGDIIDAAKAEEWGLVSRVVPHDELMPATLELAAKIAANPPITTKLAKRALYVGSRSELDPTLEYEGHLQRMCFNTKDFAEAMTAFLEKREPVFQGE